jgi:hypothetical protein
MHDVFIAQHSFTAKVDALMAVIVDVMIVAITINQ